ncbi:Piso0_001328 [Millerozyma farinosa CBS 7064]|uniref:Piso0_001328 protein n=1 Tax=Pichia sorbitophila (strain ATCC MYA-4447 / BCRC 22081 / CBS 7064 / NBRC 10061 / NRRL Y-12695) TaxID=559304 RepID=G8YMV6_PICSO|nr:Piso0_001328 [Millerozyma farinosa CBS 7064]
MVIETHLYDILSVSPSATVEEISKSYKRAALKYHPDKTNHDPKMTETFKELTRAYEILRDDASRKTYDRYGEAGLNGNLEFKGQTGRPRRQNGSYNMHTANNIFSQVFQDINSIFESDPFMSSFDTFSHMHMNPGAGFKMGASGGSLKKHVQPAPGERRPRLVRGEDIHHTCKVILQDLFHGKVLKFQLPKMSRCNECNGAGGFNPKTCRTCQGSGKVVVTMFNNFTRMQEVTICDQCVGTGIFIASNQLCRNCDRGFRKERKIVKIFILPGMKDGDRVILKGEADEGPNIIPGDLIIHIQESSHPSLIRKSSDLFKEQDIDLKTALLGGSIVIGDFITKGNDLKLYINAHGRKDFNDSIDSNIEQGEVVGVIDPANPKIVHGYGMPMNPRIVDNEVYQNPEGESASVFELDNYPRGDLFIKFNLKLPKSFDFSFEELSMLSKLLPSTEDNSTEALDDSAEIPQQYEVAHVSNIPDYISMSENGESNRKFYNNSDTYMNPEMRKRVYSSRSNASSSGNENDDYSEDFISEDDSGSEPQVKSRRSD